MLVLLSPQGDTLWTRRTAGPTVDYYSSVILGNDGNFVLTASLNTIPQWQKVNAAGQVVAQTPINYDSTDIGAVSLVFREASSRGGYWVMNIKGTVGNARKLLHLTENGVIDQTKPLHGNGYTRISSIVPAAGAGGYLACEDGRLARFSATLDTLWTKTIYYTAPNGYRAPAGPQLVRPLPDGNFVLAGQFFNVSGNRVYLGKVTPTGQILRDTVLFRQGGSEYVNGLLVEPGTGNYVFSGYASQGPLGRADLFFGRHAAWRVLGTRRPARQPVLALDAWPNPLDAGQDELRLRSGRPLTGDLVLRDALGRTVRSWPAARAVATEAGQAVSVAGVPAGAYLLSGTAPDGRRYVARVLRQ